MTEIYLGIDNGISGGLVALSATPGAGIIAKCPTPIHRVRGFNEIDGLKLILAISEMIQGTPATIIVEECPEHSRQKSTMRSMATSYGIICGAVSAGLLWCKLVRVRSGNPKDSWQRAMLNCKQGDTKPAALTLARSLWPAESWLATERSKKPHDGMIDAALIAEYARREKL